MFRVNIFENSFFLAVITKASGRLAWAESLRLRKRCLGDVRGCAVVLCGEGQPSLKKGPRWNTKKSSVRGVVRELGSMTIAFLSQFLAFFGSQVVELCFAGI